MSKITYKITQGMYVLTTKNAGCMVDSVSQISSGVNPLISVAVNKSNYTNQVLQKEEKFALSVLGFNNDPSIIETFGMKSSRNFDKFSKVDTKNCEDIPIILDSLGYCVCQIIDRIDADTHTLFIGRLLIQEVFKDEEPMSYSYYQNNKEKLLKIESKNQTAWICLLCGYIYYGETLPENYTCPVCGANSTNFVIKT